MKTTNRLISLFAGMLFATTMMADVVYEHLLVDSGFNRDVIAEQGPSTQYAKSYLIADTTVNYWSMATESVIRAVNSKNSYFKQHPEEIETTAATGWPDDLTNNPANRIIRVVEAAKDNPLYAPVTWQLAAYDKKNVLTIRPVGGATDYDPNKVSPGIQNGEGTLKFKKVGSYDRLFYLLVAAKEGGVSNPRKVHTSVYYTDGSMDTVTFEFAGLSGKDAQNKTGHQVRKVNIYENVYEKNSSKTSGTAFATVFDMPVDPSKLIHRIEFKNTLIGTAVMIFAVTGRTADIAAPDEESTEVEDIQNHQFTISWDGVPEAETYRVDVATDEDFQNMVEGYNNKEVSKTDTIVSGLEEDGDYYWRVRAVKADGGQSASSAPRRVRTAGSNPPETSETSTDIEEMLEGYAGYRAVVPSIKILRTLCRNGYFNTLCLPFSMNAEQIAASPIAGVRVFEFIQASKTNNELTIEISPEPIDHIDAGVPYLVNWVPTLPEWIGEDGLVFENVNITTYKGDTIGNNDQVQFIGNIGIASMVESDRDNLFLGAYNTLYWPENEEHETRLRGFRAYFKIPSSGSNAVARNTPARIVMHSETATDIESIQPADTNVQKILRNGQLLIIRDGKAYSILGVSVSPK